MRKVYVKCPYCGCPALVELVDGYHQRTIVSCDTEGGDKVGCGKDFVADITVKAETKALKIEGEEDNADENPTYR